MTERNIEIIEDAFFKVYINEILEGEKEKNGFRIYLYIKWNDFIFKIRKIRILGRVADILEREKFIDLLLVDPTGEIIVRLWKEKISSYNFNINDLLEVFGTIRMFGEKIYINPYFIRKEIYTENNDEKRKKEIEENRKYIAEIHRMKVNEQT